MTATTPHAPRLYARDIKITPDQQKARDAIMSGLSGRTREMVLSGPAGSGKTTLMRRIILDLELEGYSVSLMAPTGKAASRLRSVTGREVRTVHSLLYENVYQRQDGSLQFMDPRSVAEGRAVAVVDEASMVSADLRRDLLKALDRGVTVLWVGDREQLLPVNAMQGPNLQQPTALLTEVHRQAAESPIVQVATVIREGRSWQGCPQVPPGYTRRGWKTTDALAQWVYEQGEGDAALLCYANWLRQEVNAKVRALQGRVLPVEPGDRLLSYANNTGLQVNNGDVLTVERVLGSVDLPIGEALLLSFTNGVQAHVFPDSFGSPALYQNSAEIKSVWDRVKVACEEARIDRSFLRADYGYALTIHKAQGSQWERVSVVYDRGMAAKWRSKDKDEARRLLYTAVTRAEAELVMWEQL
uniref:AAA domain containing protein n=1 Tax=uncultured Caudovirales phage TaxID=2100421 RepID=A0A6J5L0D0_9CAUD|nr:AAA domain containing protein [uncultured Caudovirales phage]